MPTATLPPVVAGAFCRRAAAGNPKGMAMNRFEMLLGYFLTLLVLAASTSGGCPAAADASSDAEDAIDDSASEIVVNSAPIASAGADQSVGAGALVVLSASGTTDADGDRLQFLWGQIGGRPTVTLQDGFSAAPRFFAPAVSSTTVLTFRLTVGDGQAISVDDVLVTITP
jgi:hypothetical protein